MYFIIFIILTSLFVGFAIGAMTHVYFMSIEEITQRLRDIAKKQNRGKHMIITGIIHELEDLEL